MFRRNPYSDFVGGVLIGAYIANSNRSETGFEPAQIISHLTWGLVNLVRGFQFSPVALGIQIGYYLVKSLNPIKECPTGSINFSFQSRF